MSNEVEGMISLSPCKSICIRTLVLQFLNRCPLSPLSSDVPNDVAITHAALSSILQHLESKDSAEVVVNVHDCGAAYRFLTSVLSITPGRWWLTGSERLLQRPIIPLIQALKSVGADICKQNDGLHIQGKSICADEIIIDGNESSQYVSALMLVAKQMGNPKIIYDKYHQRSLSYINMTENILQKYYEKNEVVEEKDWSAAIFWYAYLVLDAAKSLLLKGLSLPSLQGDAVMAQWFSVLGISTRMTDEGIVIRKERENRLEEAVIDVRQNIDLAPVLVAMAALLPMKLTLTGVRNLNLKESQRKDNLIKDLDAVADFSSPDDDTLVVEGRILQHPLELHLSSHQDHRLVMAYNLLALRHPVTIDNADCVCKSYPGFEKNLAQLKGGNQ
ncbi:MAG: hypothetical protein MJZ46_04955 [Bacteroidales bacterium]|nr:hypothetical protein [Bacteroidales bacterium]